MPFHRTAAHRSRLLACALLLALAGPVPEARAQTAPGTPPAAPSGASPTALAPDVVQALMPHRAVYQVELTQSRSNSLLGVSGSMFYEWRDACDAWETDQKFNLDYIYSDQPESALNSQYTTRETKDGREFNFDVKRTRNGELFQEFRGRGEREGDQIKVTFTRPDEDEFTYPATLFFPTGHTVGLLNAVRQGKKLFFGTLFDGSDDEGPVSVNVVVGPAATLDDVPEALRGALTQGEGRRLRMAFFKPNDPSGKPDYEMSAVMLPNGVVTAMTIDYAEFSVKGTLKGLEPVPARACK